MLVKLILCYILQEKIHMGGSHIYVFILAGLLAGLNIWLPLWCFTGAEGPLLYVRVCLQVSLCLLDCSHTIWTLFSISKSIENSLYRCQRSSNSSSTRAFWSAQSPRPADWVDPWALGARPRAFDSFHVVSKSNVTRLILGVRGSWGFRAEVAGCTCVSGLDDIHMQPINESPSPVSLSCSASVWRSCDVDRPLISDICGTSLTDHLHPPLGTSVNQKYQSNKNVLKWATAQMLPVWVNVALSLTVWGWHLFVFYCGYCIFYAWNTQKKTSFVYLSSEKRHFKMTKHQTCWYFILSGWVDVSGCYVVQFRNYERRNHTTVTRQQEWLLIINRKRKSCSMQTEKCRIQYVMPNNEMVAAAVAWI